MEVIELREKLIANGFNIKYYAERNFAICFKTGHELSVSFNRNSQSMARFATNLYDALSATNVEIAGFNPKGEWMRIKDSKHSVVSSIDCTEVYERAVKWARRYGK